MACRIRDSTNCVNNRCGIIEYSDLPRDLAEERDDHGILQYRAGSPAIHVFSVPFLERVTSGAERLAFHVARKKVPHFDTKSWTMTNPDRENALKFELFVFDTLPHADRWLAVSVKRNDEFAPLKNATGADSATAVQQAMTNLAASWLRQAGVTVPPDNPHTIEISPLFALTAEDCAAKLPAGFTITGPTLLRNDVS